MITPLDISTSALVAQRTRLNAIANNIANLSTTRDETGAVRPYQPRYVIFQTDEQPGDPMGAAGVRVEDVRTSNAAPRLKYEPHHPDANAEGFVAYPNIDMTTEFVDALEAARAYEANLGVIEVSKDLNNQTLKILA